MELQNFTYILSKEYDIIRVMISYIVVEFQNLLRKSGLRLAALHNVGGCVMLG